MNAFRWNVRQGDTIREGCKCPGAIISSNSIFAETTVLRAPRLVSFSLEIPYTIEDMSIDVLFRTHMGIDVGEIEFQNNNSPPRIHELYLGKSHLYW